jgi:D-xylose transport system permease protein
MTNDNAQTNTRQSFSVALADTLRANIRQYTMIAVLLVIWLTFTILTEDGLFISARNLSNLFLQMVTIAILANGMLLVMVAGHIDLSAGSVCGTLGAIAAFLMQKAGLDPMLAIAITLFVGFLVGTWHGYWVAYRGVPAFIVTLASMTAFKGFTLFVTNGATIAGFTPFFKGIGQAYVPRLFYTKAPFHDSTILIFAASIVIFIVMDIRKRNKRIANGLRVLPLLLETVKIVVITAAVTSVAYVFGSYMGLPYALLILATVIILFTIITTQTPFGRHIYAVGGNAEAARLSGVNVKRTMMSIFMLMGTLTAVASIVFTARLDSATTSAGSLFELEAVAACIIGGTSTKGGIGTVFGALIGALVMASLDNGMSLMNIDIMYQYIVKGAILLLAVWIDTASKRR